VFCTLVPNHYQPLINTYIVFEIPLQVLAVSLVVLLLLLVVIAAAPCLCSPITLLQPLHHFSLVLQATAVAWVVLLVLLKATAACTLFAASQTSKTLRMPCSHCAAGAGSGLGGAVGAAGGDQLSAMTCCKPSLLQDST
jgi:hypothetical protein